MHTHYTANRLKINNNNPYQPAQGAKSSLELIRCGNTVEQKFLPGPWIQGIGTARFMPMKHTKKTKKILKFMATGCSQSENLERTDVAGLLAHPSRQFMVFSPMHWSTSTGNTYLLQKIYILPNHREKKRNQKEH